MQSSQFEFSILVNGRPVREYGSKGVTYVEGRAGQDFRLRFRNNSASRVLVIPSIDGLSVLDGENATALSRGYVVQAYSSLECEGWRTTLQDVSKFVFSAKAGSYAASKGKESQAGVIGVMVLAEKPQLPKFEVDEHHHHHYPKSNPWPEMPIRPAYPFGADHWRCGGTSTGAPTGGGGYVAGDRPIASHVILRSMAANSAAEGSVQSYSGKAADFNLGTGWGESIKSECREVEFERGEVLTVMEVHYTDAAGLLAAGIDVNKTDKAVSAPVLPRAFGEFCKPPGS